MKARIVDISESDVLTAVERSQGPGSRYAIACQSREHMANFPEAHNNFIVADMFMLTYVCEATEETARVTQIEVCEHCLPDEARALWTLQNLDQPGAVS